MSKSSHLQTKALRIPFCDAGFSASCINQEYERLPAGWCADGAVNEDPFFARVAHISQLVTSMRRSKGAWCEVCTSLLDVGVSNFQSRGWGTVAESFR